VSPLQALGGCGLFRLLSLMTSAEFFEQLLVPLLGRLFLDYSTVFSLAQGLLCPKVGLDLCIAVEETQQQPTTRVHPRLPSGPRPN
jgi:hypothetical protein